MCEINVKVLCEVLQNHNFDCKYVDKNKFSIAGVEVKFNGSFIESDNFRHRHDYGIRSVLNILQYQQLLEAHHSVLNDIQREYNYQS